MIFHSPSKKTLFFDTLKIDNFIIKKVDNIKYLGMYIDEHLKWDKHVETLCNKLSRNFYLFYSLRNILNEHLKRQLYFSLVYSHISYGIELYGTCNNSLLNKVQIIQNKLLKTLYQLPYRTNTNELHTALNILKVEDIHKAQILKFVYESLNGLSITQFKSYYQLQNRLHDHDTRERFRLRVQLIRTRYGEYSLLYRGPFLWNKLDKDLQGTKSLFSFKKKLKKFFIDNYTN